MSIQTEEKIKKHIEDTLSFFPSAEERELIQRAFDLAHKAHAPQKRESGEPYIIHPVEAALTLAQMKMDAQTVAAALLHDVVDDTPVTLKEVRAEFGEDVAFLVDGVSKLGKIKYRGVERHAENLRKMLIAMAQDVRVILIKFADRLHNIKTLSALPQRKRERIALETLEIYAPIAMRLGVSELAKQLEDLAFPYVYPEQYKYVKEESNYRLRDGEKYLKKLLPVIRKELAKENIKPLKTEIRAKHYYSLWRKLERNSYNWSRIHDLIAVRIIVESVEECYKTLGVVHKLWKPLPGRIKDYIALPKPNGYQSLHTTVFCLDGKITEIQIRTREMQEEAEYGIAAHWRYKKGGSTKNLDDKYKWVSQLQDWKKDASPTEEFLNNLKIDVFGDRIFVFTPKGDVFDLPQGATPVDLAYTVHSDVGDRCAGAIANGKMVALNYELQNGDVLEIITSKNKTPSQAWLGFVKTRTAKNRIRKWFREQNKEQSLENGRDLVGNEVKSLTGKNWNTLGGEIKKEMLKRFSMNSEDELFIAVGQGDISLSRVMHTIVDKEEEEKNKEDFKKPQKPSGAVPVAVAGISGLQTHIAQCCNPVKPEEIAAYITVDKGASVHKINCPNLRQLKRSEKILPAYWLDMEGAVPVSLELLVLNRIGMLQDISRVVATLNINILGVKADSEEDEESENKGAVRMRAKFQINNLAQLKTLIEKLKTIDGVINVNRG
ncbi:MAG: bifunctional (p)ppGpp synthetase/guanosine-3',5'-bis(diphosphate) 3'-pyrophosphohydrolase [Candidatus Spechtbacterales bacterium]